MFHWICPECGQEIAPGVKECLVCEPQSAPPVQVSSDVSTKEAPAPEVFLAAPLVEAHAPLVEPPDAEPQVILQPEVVEKPEPLIIPQRPAVVLPGAPSPEPETFADRLADLAERLHGERIPYASPRTIQGTAAPRPHVDREAERRPVILDITP